MSLVPIDNPEELLQDTPLMFGGYPVQFHYGYENKDIIMVTCKGVTGSLDQLEDWLFNHIRNPYQPYYFGYGEKRGEIVRDGELVKIACLSEEYVGFKIKLNKLIHGVNRAKNRK